MVFVILNVFSSIEDLFNSFSFIFLHKQVKIKRQHNDKNFIDGDKGHTELVSSSLKLIARKIGKNRHTEALCYNHKICYSDIT